MLTIEANANATFSYAGTVSNLDGSVQWGISAAVRVQSATSNLDTFTAYIAQANDFQTSGLWVLSISATAAQTQAWYTAAKAQRGLLSFDIKLYNTQADDPVLYTETVTLRLTPTVTP